MLCIQGYVDAAAAFQRESGAEPGVDLSAIQNRMEIRQAVQSGQIERAIDLVNDLDPEILEDRAELLFHLRQQQLIEFIREGKIDDALEFAQEHLAPRGEENPEFLEELEKTVALLLFDNPQVSPMSDLLELSQRQRTAGELNAAILTSQNRSGSPKLPRLLKFLEWSQNQLSKRANFPRIADFVAGEPVKPSTESMDQEMSEAAQD